MIGHGAKFGRKKEAAVAALLTARNTEEAARAVGIGLTGQDPNAIWHGAEAFRAVVKYAEENQPR